MFPLGLLQELLALGTAVFSIVFSSLEKQCQQEAASTKLVSPASSFSLCCCLSTN